MKISSVVSVPSFGDSFFMMSILNTRVNYMRVVSVPSFGDSFFIGHCCVVPFDSKR